MNDGGFIHGEDLDPIKKSLPISQQAGYIACSCLTDQFRQALCDGPMRNYEYTFCMKFVTLNDWCSLETSNKCLIAGTLAKRYLADAPEAELRFFHPGQDPFVKNCHELYKAVNICFRNYHCETIDGHGHFLGIPIFIIAHICKGQGSDIPALQSALLRWFNQKIWDAAFPRGYVEYGGFRGFPRGNTRIYPLCYANNETVFDVQLDSESDDDSME